METIFAQATAPGKSGVAIIRVSGEAAFTVGSDMAGTLPEPGKVALRAIRGRDGVEIDRGLVLTFEEGASFTGEKTVEFHLHGSIAIVRAVSTALESFPNVRPALPGEFTRRALENERMDLVQVEGLADLIDAETELQRQQALAVQTGALSKRVDVWRDKLLEAAALVETTIDFSDEDIPADLMPDVRSLILAVSNDLRTELSGYGAAERIRDGFEVAILGAPNAGKSTLMNAIARRQVSLTSDLAGTTRDVLECRVDLSGIPVTFLDTAGLRDSSDPLERAGIDLARTRAAGASLRVWLRTDDDRPDILRDDDFIVDGKADLTGHGVSGLTGAGISQLMEDIANVLKDRIPELRGLIRERHRIAVSSALDSLDSAGTMLVHDGEAELIAEHIRFAAIHLGEMIGRLDVEDLLDGIFSRFCIGK